MKKYDEEFKQSAVKKGFDGQSVATVARNLDISEGLLHKWKRARLESSFELEKELIELKKGLREVEMERDILKKVALMELYFGDKKNTVRKNKIVVTGKHASKNKQFIYTITNGSDINEKITLNYQ